VDVASLLDRRQPWTVDDWWALPDEAPSRRIEIDDGSLVVNPPPAWQHDATANRLATMLAGQLPAGFEAVAPAAVALSRHRLRVPDVVVVRLSPAALARPVLHAEHLVLAAEVESPTSRGRDRLAKPAQYAAAGIPAYWRVEPEVPAVTAYELRDGAYVEVARAEGEQELRVERPFAASVVPSRLLPGAPR